MRNTYFAKMSTQPISQSQAQASGTSSASAAANKPHQYRTHTCRNCGLVGHLYKDCPHPIMSFGLICYRIHNNQPEYIMIQRRDSLSFMEFIRGKYSIHDIAYICNLLSMMTQSERQQLIEAPFHTLWNQVWYQPCISKHTQEFADSKEKFDALKTGFYHNKIFVSLALLVKSTFSQFLEPEWGFPKGRRKLREEDIDCAIREFCEETGFKKTDVDVLKHIPPSEEIFYGTNKVLYRHVYYVCTFNNTKSHVGAVDPKNIQQAREVRQVRWFNYERVLANIRPHNKERKALFYHAHKTICEYHRLPVPAAAFSPTPSLQQQPSISTPLELTIPNSSNMPVASSSVASSVATSNAFVSALKADAPCFIYGTCRSKRGPPPGFEFSSNARHCD